MYSESIRTPDLGPILEDIAKLVINIIVKDDVQKILICLLRIDNFDQDKDL